jgi:hypothetical protein
MKRLATLFALLLAISWDLSGRLLLVYLAASLAYQAILRGEQCHYDT